MYSFVLTLCCQSFADTLVGMMGMMMKPLRTSIMLLLMMMMMMMTSDSRHKSSSPP